MLAAMIKRCFLLFWLCFTHHTYSQEEWLFVTEPFPPYFAEQLPQQGWLADLTVTALASQNITASIEFTTWARAIKLVEKNKRTAVLGAYFSTEREQIFLYSRPLAHSFTGLFKRKNTHISYDGSLASLEDYNISKGSDYIVGDEFSKQRNLTTTESKDLVSSLRVLQLGRVDLVAGTKEVGEYWLKNHSILQSDTAAEIEYIEPHLAYHHLYIVFSRSSANSEQRLSQLESGLTAIINNGEAASVLLRHGFSEAKTEQYLEFLKR